MRLRRRQQPAVMAVKFEQQEPTPWKWDPFADTLPLGFRREDDMRRAGAVDFIQEITGDAERAEALVASADLDEGTQIMFDLPGGEQGHVVNFSGAYCTSTYPEGNASDQEAEGQLVSKVP